MIDAIDLVQRVLLATPAVTTQLGTNPAGSIYGGSDLPEGYDPTLGPAILVYLVEGDAHPEIKQEIMPLVRVRVWAQQNAYQLCHSVMRACFDALHGLENEDFAADGKILTALCTLLPQTLTDPDTSWVNEIATFQIDAISKV